MNMLDIQPGALLVRASAQLTVSELNKALAAHGLCLPIYPLLAEQSLAELIANNAGGRRGLRHGTLARYLRAAEVQTDASQGRLYIGGPTLKRATGYGLNRALVGDRIAASRLGEVTLSLRPLPAAHGALLIDCADLVAASTLANQIMAKGLSLSALALRQQEEAAQLLVEFEGNAKVIARQTSELQHLLAGAQSTPLTGDYWQPWAQLAAEWQTHTGERLSLSLPRAVLPSFITQARSLISRYGMELTIWGDGGVGTLHCTLHGRSSGEQAQASALLFALAQGMGGAVATELGLGAGVSRCDGAGVSRWQGEQVRSLFYSSTTDVNATATTYSDSPLRTARLTPAPARSATHPLTPSPLERLTAIVGQRYVITRPEDLGTYEQDASIARATGRPLAVVLPANTAEVSAVLAYANEAGLTVVSRGAGSGLAGGSTPSDGAIVLGLSRLDQLEIDAAQMVARVGAGAITADVQRAAEGLGLYYPPDPSSLPVSTVGGNIACNAGGPRCLKYGVTADYVLALTAVLADGTIIKVGDGLVGQSPNMGLLHLLVGSEGTLAVITEATLRLIPLPPARRTTLAIFDRLHDACTTVEAIMAGGIIPAGLELMDATTMLAVEEYLHLGLPRDAGAMLLLLADGEPEEVAAEAEALAAYARQGGARSVQVAQNNNDEAALWRARRAVSPALARIRPNRLGEDICVPVSRIAECVEQTQVIAAAYALPIVVFGHAGDGNLHPNILFDSRDPAQVERVWGAASAIFNLALDLGGTLSGEHGIGTLKRPFMRRALGDELIAHMWQIKRQFDPQNQLNPGKVLPE
jgi:glycolate oxidase subunit GlcD